MYKKDNILSRSAYTSSFQNVNCDKILISDMTDGGISKQLTVKLIFQTLN